MLNRAPRLGARAAQVMPGQEPIVSVGFDDGSLRNFSLPELEPIWASPTTHDGPVLAVTQLPTDHGPIVVSAGDDGLIRLWTDPSSEGRPLVFDGHAGGVNCLAGPLGDGALLLSGGDDGCIGRWNLLSRRREYLRPLPERSEIHSIAVFERAGQAQGAAATESGTVWIFAVADGRPTGERFSTDGVPIRALAVGCPDDELVLLAGTDRGAVLGWRLSDGSPCFDQENRHHGAIRTLCLMPDPGGFTLISGGNDSSLVVSRGARTEPVRIGDHRRGVLAGSPFHCGERRLLVSSDHDGRILLTDVDTGRIERESHPAASDAVLAGAPARLDDTAVLVVAGTANRLQVWDGARQRSIRELPWDRDKVLDMTSLGPSSTAVVLATASGSVVLVDLENGEQSLLGQVPADGSPCGITFDADSATCFCGAADGSVHAFSVTDRRPRRYRYAPQSAAIRALAIGRVGGRSLLAAASDRGLVTLVDVAEGRTQSSLRADGRLRAVLLRGEADGLLCLAASNNRTIFGWRSTPGSRPTELRPLRVSGRPRALTVARSGQLLVAGDDATVSAWRPSSSVGQVFERVPARIPLRAPARAIVSDVAGAVWVVTTSGVERIELGS